jgi:hypothetical protein
MSGVGRGVAFEKNVRRPRRGRALRNLVLRFPSACPADATPRIGEKAMGSLHDSDAAP